MSHTVAKRIDTVLETALSEAPERPGHAASRAERIATCRAALAEFPSALRPAPTYDDERTVRVGFDRDGILGLVLERYDYYRGSAHPNTAYAASHSTSRAPWSRYRGATSPAARAPDAQRTQ